MDAKYSSKMHRKHESLQYSGKKNPRYFRKCLRLLIDLMDIKLMAWVKLALMLCDATTAPSNIQNLIVSLLLPSLQVIENEPQLSYYTSCSSFLLLPHIPSFPPSLHFLFCLCLKKEKTSPWFFCLKRAKQTGSWQASHSSGSGFRPGGREEGGEDMEEGKGGGRPKERKKKKTREVLEHRTFLTPAWQFTQLKMGYFLSIREKSKAGIGKWKENRRRWRVGAEGQDRRPE